MSDEKFVLCEKNNNVALVTLNKPKLRNSLCVDMLAQLRSTFQCLAADNDVRVVVLTGTGRGFCAGADLTSTKGFKSSVEGIEEHYKPAFMEIVGMEKPVIACVNGAAAGGGMGLAMLCDLMTMGKTAYLKSAFSDIALIPDCGVNWLLPQALGYRRAYQYAIEAEKITAQVCLESGLANKLFDDDHLLAQTLEWAATIANRAPLALGLTKKAMRNSYTESLFETFSAEGQLQDICMGSKDFSEGIGAFFEKREPNFTGQ